MQGEQLKDHEVIEKKLGIPKTNCSCDECANMCKTAPCMGTPKEINKLIDLGYKPFLQVSVSCTGWQHGFFHPPITSVQFRSKPDGSCAMFNNGLCAIHNKGIKPSEGMLAHHDYPVRDFERSAHWEVMKMWCVDENQKLIEDIFKKMSNAL